MHYVSYDVKIEPTLQVLQGESLIHNITSTNENARLDIKANGLWRLRFNCCFFDMKIFNSRTNSCQKDSVEAYKYHESLKCLKYEQRILDAEKSNFVPLVFSCMRGAGPSTTRIIKQLRSKTAENKDESYSNAVTYIGTNITFALLRRAIICLRGCRGSKRPTDIDCCRNVMMREGRLDS